MDPSCNSRQPPRPWVPKDGMGPRGLPDCYYTSRVLNSTFRYVRFLKKLRAREEEERKGTETLISVRKDKQRNEFFGRCDRRSLINKVAYRVDLCLEAYEDDLRVRREKLLNKLATEEEINIRKFVEQAQEGPKLIWQEKKDRLAFLLAKRKQEHDAKHSAPPLSKASHLLPCLVKIRSEECRDFQLYQIREHQMRKEAEKEMEKMWHDVAMKEADALVARMEYEEMERVRRENECKQYNDHTINLNRLQREKDRETLKEQVLQRKMQAEEDRRKLAEEERASQERRVEIDQAKKEMRKERQETVAKQEADSKLVNDTWDKLAALKKDDSKLEEELRRQKKRDLDECNRKIVELKNNIQKFNNNNENLIMQEGLRRQDELDLKRCLRRKWSERTKMADAATNKQTYLEKEAALNKDDDDKEYYDQLRCQLDELVKQKELTDAQARKLYQNDLAEQIAYNNLLKERIRQDKLDESKKGEIATREYMNEMAEMLSRPYYSNAVHPFLRQMDSGLKIQKCPCLLPNYCAEPKPKEAS